MSFSTSDFHDIAQLRFWRENEIKHRELAQAQIVDLLYHMLEARNRAWTCERVEGPILTPRNLLSSAYTDNDIWVTKYSLAEQDVVLRAETTTSTYAAVRQLHPQGLPKRPFIYWQSGKSFRREETSTASRLRFFEFWQCELQCLHPADTKDDYQELVIDPLIELISWLTRSPTRQVPSDRLPEYSTKTTDIEVRHRNQWREMASISMRTDFHESVRNLEVAVGLDRIVEVFFSPENHRK